MDDITEDPAVTDNSISVNYIKENTDIILVVTVKTEQGVTVEQATVTDPGARVIFLTTVSPVTWDTLEHFDRWYTLYKNINQV